jgi:hypothetical protein
LQDILYQDVVDLPLWLAEGLTGSNIVRVGLSPPFKERSVRTELKHNPVHLRLRDKSPYYYEVAMRLAKVSVEEEARSLPSAAQAALGKRTL